MNPLFIAVIVSFFLGAGLGGAGAWNWQSSKVEAITVKYDSFVENTRLLGKAAAKETETTNARNQANKTKADHENTLALATLRADIKRLRDSRASSSYLPGPASTSTRPDLACFDRTELEQSIRVFDVGLQGIVDEGSETTVNLNTAKQWATSQ